MGRIIVIARYGRLLLQVGCFNQQLVGRKRVIVSLDKEKEMLTKEKEKENNALKRIVKILFGLK